MASIQDFNLLGLVLLSSIGILLFAIWQMALPERLFFGRASLLRAALEVGVIGVVTATPVMVVGAFLVGKIWIDQRPLMDTVVSTIIIPLHWISYLAIMPLWFTIRLSPDSPRPLWVEYFRATSGFFVVILLTSILDFVLLSVPWTSAIKPGFDLGLLFGAAFPVIWATVTFVLMRVTMDVLIRTSRPIDLTALSTAAPEKGPYYWVLAAGGIAVLALWIGSSFLYFFRDAFRDALYLPPSYVTQGSLGIVPFHVPTPLERPPLVAILVAAPSLGILAVSLFLSVSVRPAEPAARLFTLLCLLYSLGGVEIFPMWGGVWLYGLALLARAFVIPVQLHFALVFPRVALTMGGPARRWKRWLPLAFYLCFIPLALLWTWFFLHIVEIAEQMRLLTQWLATGAVVTPDKLGLALSAMFWALMALVFVIVNMLGWIMSAVFLTRTWLNVRRTRQTFENSRTDSQPGVNPQGLTLREAIARSEQQLLWLGVGTAIVAVIFALAIPLAPLVASIPEGWADAGLRGCLFIVVLATTIALTGYRLWDINLLIKQTINYFLLSLIFLVSYAVGVSLVAWLAGGPSPLVAPLGGLAAALILGSVRERVQATIERFFDRSKLEFERYLEELGKRLSEAIVLDELTQLLTKTVPDQLQLIAAWLVQPLMTTQEETRLALLAQGAQVVLPLTAGREVIGMYGLGAKRSGASLNSEEQKLIRTLSYHAATALANAIKLEEREQIFREIHTYALGDLYVARNFIDDAEQIAPGRESIQAKLARAREQILIAIRELRRTITMSGPESLKLPLHESLQKDLSSFATAGKFEAVFRIEGEPCQLPAKVENTLNYIARETLNNVLKYANAKHVQMTLSYAQLEVNLAIKDDGEGFTPNTVVSDHFGLRSMTDLIEQLRGILKIQSASKQGVQIEVWIPIPGGDGHANSSLDS
jgi:signal transduction histidine kinase